MTAAARPRRPFPIGGRGIALVSIALSVLIAWIGLDASLDRLVPGEGGLGIVRNFFGKALSPAFTYEGTVPSGTRSLLSEALDSGRRTVVFAAAGMSLAMVFGLAFGFLGSTAWWAGDGTKGSTGIERAIRTMIGPAVWWFSRVIIVAMRSVHELLWAVLFLAAFGLNTLSAVVALAIPYGGTLAKIFSEMIDEAPRDGAMALRALGAGPTTVFFTGLVPRAAADMSAYTLYRFECAIRSSAVLGFFGFPTLGYAIKLSFENLHYGEVWTYLYTLVAIVIVIELWSGALRKRFVA